MNADVNTRLHIKSSPTCVTSVTEFIAHSQKALTMTGFVGRRCIYKSHSDHPRLSHPLFSVL